MTALSVRRVASLLVTVVALLLVGAFVVQAVPGVVGADASYVVLSGSMEPTISPGDSVVVKSVDPADIESGDVITYKRSGESTPVTHRVVEVLDREDGLAFRTAGDANDSPDPQPVPAESVTGEVWFAIPLIGHVILFANTPTGLGVLVGLPVVAFVVSELYEFVRDDPAPDVADDDVHADAEEADAHAVGTDSQEPAEAPADAALEDAGAQTGAQAGPTGATGAAAEPTSAPPAGASETDADSDGIAITSMDLRLSGVAFFALAVYSGYVAYLDLTPLRVGIFAGAAMLVVFVATVFVFGEDVDGSDAAGRNTSREASTSSVEGSTSTGSTEAATDGGEAATDGGEAATDGGEAATDGGEAATDGRETGDAVFGGDDDAS